jgi:mannan endo-1,4-beta-mannosidase
VVTNWATENLAIYKEHRPQAYVTLGDEGWLAPSSWSGDGSYAYSDRNGFDLVANLNISTLDNGVFHIYPNSRRYNYTCGVLWIQVHDAIGKVAGKPVVGMEIY